jgi:LacI family transcriptional regulator
MAETPRAAKRSSSSSDSPEPVRLKDVALAAGVSRTAVSMAFRNHYSIPAQTRERILEVAARLRYSPDPDVAKLMERIRDKRRNRTANGIAYITAFNRRDEWKHFHTHRTYYESARDRAEECGFKLEEFWLRDPGITARRLSEIIRNRGIEAVLIAPLPGPVCEQQALFDGCRWSYFSVVALGYSFQAVPVCRVCFHHFDAMTKLMHELRVLGYKNPGLSMSLSMDERTHHFYRSAYLSEQSLSRSGRLIPVHIPARWDRESFARWFVKHRPDVVISVDYKIRTWMRELGIAVPREAGVALIDLPNATANIPDASDFAGIDQCSERVAVAAVNMLISLHRFGERGVDGPLRVMMTEGQFVMGSTIQKMGSQSLVHSKR